MVDALSACDETACAFANARVAVAKSCALLLLRSAAQPAWQTFSTVAPTDASSAQGCELTVKLARQK
jgi:hypothetical protein